MDLLSKESCHLLVNVSRQKTADIVEMRDVSSDNYLTEVVVIKLFAGPVDSDKALATPEDALQHRELFKVESLKKCFLIFGPGFDLAQG